MSRIFDGIAAFGALIVAGKIAYAIYACFGACESLAVSAFDGGIAACLVALTGVRWLMQAIYPDMRWEP